MLLEEIPNILIRFDHMFETRSLKVNTNLVPTSGNRDMFQTAITLNAHHAGREKRMTPPTNEIFLIFYGVKLWKLLQLPNLSPADRQHTLRTHWLRDPANPWLRAV